MPSQKIESLKLIIDEQKRDNEYLLHIYNRMRATEGLLLTASFAIIAYLYSAGPEDNGKTTVLDRLFFPTEEYGQVIYFIAMGFLAHGVYKLMTKAFGKNPWMTAYDRQKDNYTYETLDTLEYIKDRYEECFDYNVSRYKQRKDELGRLFYQVLISAIILIVIKTLG